MKTGARPTDMCTHVPKDLLPKGYVVMNHVNIATGVPCSSKNWKMTTLETAETKQVHYDGICACDSSFHACALACVHSGT